MFKAWSNDAFKERSCFGLFSVSEQSSVQKLYHLENVDAKDKSVVEQKSNSGVEKIAHLDVKDHQQSACLFLGLKERARAKVVSKKWRRWINAQENFLYNQKSTLWIFFKPVQESLLLQLNDKFNRENPRLYKHYSQMLDDAYRYVFQKNYYMVLTSLSLSVESLCSYELFIAIVQMGLTCISNIQDQKQQQAWFDDIRGESKSAKQIKKSIFKDVLWHHERAYLLFSLIDMFFEHLLKIKDFSVPYFKAGYVSWLLDILEGLLKQRYKKAYPVRWWTYSRLAFADKDSYVDDFDHNLRLISSRFMEKIFIRCKEIINTELQENQIVQPDASIDYEAPKLTSEDVDQLIQKFVRIKDKYYETVDQNFYNLKSQYERNDGNFGLGM